MSASRSAPPEPVINVTPLVDVVLVLLIIFMVIAPNLQEGTPVEMPDVVQPDKRAKKDGIDLTMTSDGQLHLDGEVIDQPALMEALRRLRAKSQDRPLVIKADAKLPYGPVREMFASVRRLGFKNVSMKVSSTTKADS